MQAIWKKVMSGGIPTKEEAAKLSAWVAANKDNIAKAGIARGESTQKAIGGPAIGVRAGQPDCPNVERPADR